MAIRIGAPTNPELITQLTKRSEVVGKTSQKTNDDQLYLHAKTGWIKLSSGVNTITDAEIASLRGQSKRTTIKGDNKLAVQNVLVGGVGIGTGIEGKNEGAVPAYKKNDSNGYRPRPGITSMTVKSKNTYGTLRVAEVSFSVWSLEDFEKMEKLYLRPGFMMLLEWGHSLYIDNSGKLQKTVETVGDDFFKQGITKDKIVERIVEIRDKASYNYEGMLGFCTNFNWNYTTEGKYECNISIISAGEIIESIPARQATLYHIPKGEISDVISILGITELDSSVERSKEQKKSIYHYLFSKMSNINTKSFTKDDILDASKLTSQIKDFKGYYVEVQIDSESFWSFDTDTPMHYIPLRVVLDIYNIFVTLKDLSKTKQSDISVTKFNLDYSKGAKFLTNPYHFSIDPTVCCLPNLANEGLGVVPEIHGNSPVVKEGAVDDILNILVTAPFLKSKFDEALDTDGKFNKSYYDIFKSILDGISNALGGINDLDIHFDEEDRGGTFHVVDRSVIPAGVTVPRITIAGLNSVFKKVDISSQISNEVSATIAIAAQGAVQNYSENVENILKWNPSVVDRIIPTKDTTSQNKNSDSAIRAANEEALLKWKEDVKKFFLTFNSYDGYTNKEMEGLKTDHTHYTVENVVRIPNSGKASGPQLVPVELSLTLEGIGGFVVTSAFRIGKGILPNIYDDKFGYLVTGTEHSIGEDSVWETSVRTRFYLFANPSKRASNQLVVVDRPDFPTLPVRTQAAFNAFNTILSGAAGNVGTGINIVIGDSQTPNIVSGTNGVFQLLGTVSTKVQVLPVAQKTTQGGEEFLWRGGEMLKWLNKALELYPVNTGVSTVAINIGTNGAFSDRQPAVTTLVNNVKSRFPTARLCVVQGSWGWGGNKRITPAQIKAYYSQFAKEGVTVIEPPIGTFIMGGDPHDGTLPVYKTIGAALNAFVALAPVIPTSQAAINTNALSAILSSMNAPTLNQILQKK